jgi:hypothetical protein
MAEEEVLKETKTQPKIILPGGPPRFLEHHIARMEEKYSHAIEGRALKMNEMREPHTGSSQKQDGSNIQRENGEGDQSKVPHDLKPKDQDIFSVHAGEASGSSSRSSFFHEKEAFKLQLKRSSLLEKNRAPKKRGIRKRRNLPSTASTEYQLCKHYTRKGGCKVGKKCIFAHSREERDAWNQEINLKEEEEKITTALRAKLAPRMFPPGSSKAPPGGYKLCRHIQRPHRTCLMGENCKFAHSEEERVLWKHVRNYVHYAANSQANVHAAGVLHSAPMTYGNPYYGLPTYFGTVDNERSVSCPGVMMGNVTTEIDGDKNTHAPMPIVYCHQAADGSFVYLPNTCSSYSRSFSPNIEFSLAEGAP